MASVQENITIKIREDGSRVVSRNIRDMGDAANDAEGSLLDLKSVLAGLVTGATLLSLAQMADQFTNLQNRLRLVTTGSENLARVTAELGKIANDTRSDFVATAELYARMATSSKELGLSQQELLNFTKSLNQAVILSGASAEEAAGGIRQLSQGMASGTLRGDELNSVLENLPAVADIIAKGLGITRGELRKMGQDGKLSATAIVDAFKAAKDELEAGFATTVPTLGQAVTVLKNNFMLFLGELDKSTGITAGLAQAIMTVANNMNILIPILAGVGSAVSIALSAAAVQKFAVEIRKLWVLMMANPFVAVAAVVTGLITTLYLLRDEIKLGIDDTTTLGDLMRAAWEDVGPAIQAVADLAAKFFGWLTDTSAGTFDQLLNDLVGYEHQNDSTWLKMLRVVVQVFDMIGATIRGTMVGANAVIAGFISAWMNSFEQLGNAINGVKELDPSKIAGAVTSSYDGYKKAATGAGDAFSKAFQAEILSQQDSGLESVLDGWLARAKEIGKDRMGKAGLGALGGGGAATIKPPVDEAALKRASKELERLKNALANIMDEADPVGAATRRLAEAQDVLTKATKAGLITQEKAAEVYRELEYLYRDQLDPLAALNRELDEHASLLRMGNEQSKIEGDLLKMTQDLRSKGIKLTGEETAQLRAKLTVEQELERIARARDQLEQDSMARKSRDVGDKISAASGLVNDPKSGYTKSDAVTGLAGDIPGLDQTTDFLTAQQEQYAVYYAAIDEMRQNDLISETGAIQAKVALFQQQYATQFQAASTALSNLAGLQKSENKKQAAIGKAAAIAQAMINTYSSATASYNAMAGIPYVGPFLGAAAAAAAVAAGMANVQAIRSQSVAFRTGGDWTVGGHGGTDSQMVNFRATPGEKISVNTPAQARAIERAGEDGERPRGPRNVNVNQTIMVQGRVDKRTPDQIARSTRRETRKEFERS